MSETTPKQAEKPLLWADMNRQELAAAMERKSLVLIPTGSTEQHADHLPVGTDTSLADAFAKRAAARMTAPVVVAPAVPFGFAPHHLSLTGTISLRLETYLAMLSDMARSIIDSGFSRAIFINGHGGNSAPLRSLVGQLGTDGLAVGMTDFCAPGLDAAVQVLKGALARIGHACEAETAMIMALSDEAGKAKIGEAARGLPPRLLKPWIPPGHSSDPVSEAGAGWAGIFHADDCGYFGDPAAADTETGNAIIEALTKGLAGFLDDFARTPLRVGISRDPQHGKVAPPLV